MFWRLFCSFLILLVGTVFPAYAEAPPTADLSDLNLEDLMNMQVTTVSKASRSVRESPASVTVITKDDIKKFGYRTLTEALRGVLGFYGTNDRNYEYLGVRGFARPGDYNTRILLLVDGHKINDPNYDYAPVAEDLGIDLDSLERLEVIKGASSAVWGTNGLLSVVNLITKKGGDVKGAGATIEYGSHNRTKAFAEYGSRTKGGLDIYSSFSALDSNGQSSIFFPEYNQSENNNGVTHHNDGEAAYRGLVRAEYDGAKLLVAHGWRRKEVPTAPYATLFYPPGNKTWDYSTRADLSYEYKVSAESHNSVFARTFFDKTNYYANYLYADTEASDGSILTNRDEGGSKLFGGELRYTTDLVDSLSLVAGIEAQRAYDLHFGYGELKPQRTSTLDLNEQFSLFSSFAELDYRIFQNFHIVGGARVDHYTAQDSHWSPRGGIVYSPWSQTTFKLLYGGAFRQPNNYERNYSDGVYYADNPGLKPEELQSYEVIVDQQLWSTMVTLDLFRFDLRKLISQTALDSGFLRYQNGGTIRSEGGEVQFVSHFDGGYLARGGMSISRAVDVYSGSVLSNSPRYLGNFGLSLPVNDGYFFVSPELQWVGARDSLHGSTIDSSYLTNCRILTDRLLTNLTLSLSVYNIFDEHTYSPAAEEHIQELLPQVGRTWMVEAQGKF